MKTKLTLSILATGIFVGSSFAANYPVQPANNGFAKKVIEYIFTDPGLAKNTTLEDRIVAAKAANQMSQLILNSIKALGLEKDGFITDAEVKKLNTYMYQHYHNQMVKLHWNDEKGQETGFHRIVNDGWVTKWYIPLKRKYKSANRIADGIFHLGLYPTVNNHKILNEDGNKNVRWRLISRWLSTYLKEDLNLKGWSKRAYYKDQIKKLKKERNAKIKQLKAQWASKQQIKQVKTEYNKKIKQLRKEMRK